MREHDELMSALEAWVRWSQFDDPHAEITDDVIQAYRAFKAAEPPLVLERELDGMYADRTLVKEKSHDHIIINGQCYRLPEGE